MRLAVLALGLAAVAAPALAGCRSGRPRAYFAAERTRGARVADARPVETKNFIPLEAQAPDLRVACEARMYDEEPVDGILVPTLRVRVYISNHGDAKFEMRPEGFAVVDDAGRRLPISRATYFGRETGVILITTAGDTAADLVFSLPEGYDIEKAASLRLIWGFRVGDTEVHHETMLVRGADRSFRNPFFDPMRGS